MTTTRRNLTDIPGNWYRSYFGDAWLNTVGRDKGELEIQAEAEFMWKALGLEPSASILDLCCGIGGHARALTRLGARVTGLDQNSKYLTEAQDAARAESLEIEWLRADMRDIPFARRWDCASCMFTSFGYLESDQEHLIVLQRLRASLRPGGRFLIDVANLTAHLASKALPVWRIEPNGAFLLQDRRFNPRTGRDAVERWLVDEHGRLGMQMQQSLRMYTYLELEALLSKGGFKSREVWGDYQFGSYDVESPRMIVLAEAISGV